MNTLVGAGPLIGTGSLDGFAIGALVSGACFLAITSPRRTRRRRADVARAGMAPLTAARSSWLREHVMATEHSTAAEPPIAGGHAVAGERRFAGEHRMTGELRMAGEHRMTGGADEERLALPEELGGPGAGLSADGRGSRAAGYRSRHRAGDPIPGSSSRGGAPRRGMLPGGAPRDSVLQDGASPDHLPSEDDDPRKSTSLAFPDSVFPGRAFPGSALPGSAFPGSALPDSAFPDSAFPDSAFPGKAFPDIAPGNGALPDVAFPGGSFGRTRRPEVRRMPRHAAPTVGFAARMTGLFASRALLSGARG